MEKYDNLLKELEYYKIKYTYWEENDEVVKNTIMFCLMNPGTVYLICEDLWSVILTFPLSTYSFYELFQSIKDSFKIKEQLNLLEPQLTKVRKK